MSGMEFFREHTVKATRKDHRCEGCGRHIEAGSSAIYYAGKWEGDFVSSYYHHDCRAAEIRLNALAGTLPDEWIRLDEAERDDFNLIRAEFPLVADRMGIAKTVEA